MKYTVHSVICDFGVFENGELKLICNSSKNALLIAAIMSKDAVGGFDCVFTLVDLFDALGGENYEVR